MSVAVGVIGLGNWGTALGNHLALEGHQVLGWARAEDIVEGINASQRNPRYQSDIKLSKNFTATSDFDQLLELPVLVVVLPSSCLNELLPLLQLDSNTIVVSAVKGIEATSLMTPLQFLQSNLKPCPKLAVLSGPSFARDVVAQKPLGIVSASYCAKTATQVAELFLSLIHI